MMLLLKVVAASGGLLHKDLVDLASKAFSNLPSTPTTASDLVEKVLHICLTITWLFKLIHLL